MRTLPRGVLVLMIVAGIAVVAGISAVATLAITGPRKAARKTEVAAQPADAGGAAAERATQPKPATPRTIRRRPATPKSQTTTASKSPAGAATESAKADEVAETTQNQPERPGEFGPREVRPPAGARGPIRFAFGAGGGGSKHLSNLPAANAAARLSLDEGQRAAIEQFEEAFKQQVDSRLLPVQQKLDQARLTLQQAWLSGNEDLKTSANEALMSVAGEQTEILSELGKEYVTGVKPYLNEEQAAQLDRAASRSIPTVVGTVQSGDGPPQITVNQGAGSITVITSETVDDGAAKKTEGDAE